MDYLDIGTVPIGEGCVQVTSSNPYLKDMLLEAERFRNAVSKKWPVPEGCPAKYGIKRFSHDFGSYYSVVVFYDPESTIASEFAFSVEAELCNFETWEALECN